MKLLRYLTILLCCILFPSLCLGAPTAIDTSTSAGATAPSEQRKAFFDTVHNTHWVFYYNGSAIEYAYSADTTTWTSAGTLPYSTSNFSIAAKEISGQFYVVLGTEANTYDIVLRRGLVGTTSIAFDSEVTALNGTAADDAYTSPSVSVDGNNKLWVGAVIDVSSTEIDDKVLSVTKSTNVVTGNLSAFDAATRLGKPDLYRRSLAVMAKGASGGMYLLAGESSKNLEAWEYDGSSWQPRNTGGDMSWFGMETNLISGTVYAIAISGSDIYVGGSFNGGVSRWNGTSWNALSSGLNSDVYALAVSGTDLYVGGRFTNAGGIAAGDRIARWDGTSWNALGSGLNSDVSALAVSGTNLYVGGNFTDAGGIAVGDYIARWDGTSWNALGSGLSSDVYALAISGTNLYVGGSFANAGGIGAGDYIARWDGTSWNALGSGLNNDVNALAVSGTDLYVGGYFTNAGGIGAGDYIARWDGTSWNALGSGLNNVVYALAVSGTDLYVGGDFTNAGGIAAGDYIARWNGTSWNALSSGLNSAVYALAVSGTDLYVGGTLTDAGGLAAGDYIAHWDGTAWNALGSGMNNAVNALAVSGTNLYVGGWFTDLGGLAAGNYIARWDGTSWNALGSGLNNGVYALAVSGTNLYVGGQFTDAGGISAADNIARWDGTSWNALDSGLNSDVRALAASGTNLYAGGTFTDAGGLGGGDYIARWDGTSWNTLGSGLNSDVYALEVSGTNLYVGGGFTDAGGITAGDYIARWDGTSWNALGSGLNGNVTALALSGTNLYVGGGFTDAGGLAAGDKITRWDGTSWNALGSGLNSNVTALAVSGTNLYVGGDFTDAGGIAAAGRIARWDGTSWNALSSGLNSDVTALAVSGTNLYAGGGFTTTSDGTKLLGYFAWYAPSIAADVDNSSEFSSLVDSSEDLHLAWTNSSGNVNYRTYDSSSNTWQTTVTISSSGTADSVSLSQRTNQDVELFWSEANTIKRREGSTPFASGNWTGASSLYATGTNTAVTSPQSEARGFMPYFFTNGASAPYQVMSDVLDFTLTISGTVSVGASPLSGVTVDGGALGNTTTATNGTYGFSGIPYGTAHTLTPSKTGYTFAPTTVSATLTSAATHNFTATLNTYTIGGTITDGTNPLAGVTVSAGALGSTTTAANGTYSFTSVSHGTAYTLTASKTGYTFLTSTVSGSLTSAATHNFTGSLNTYAISGTVTDGSNPVPGVTVSAGALGTSTTAANGTYSFSASHAVAYQLIFSHPNYDLEPPSISGTLTSSLTQNIIATRKAVPSSIWGTVTFNGQALSGVEVSDPILGAKTTDIRGRYEFQNVSPGQTYSLIAKKRGYAFAPVRHSGTKTNSETNLPFIASAGAVVSGVLEQNGKPIPDAKVFLVTSQDEEPLEATTGADGAYEFISVPVGTASLHAEKHGITIDKIDELTLEARSYELENFVDMTTLNKQSYGFWNGFLGMVNILEIVNKGSENLSIVVTLATDTGEVPRGVVRYTVAPGQEQDIVLNSISGFSADHYGLVALESNHEEYDARVTLYAPASEQGDIPFSYSVPVSNKREDKTYMPYNSYNPSRSALDQGLLVANWVSIGNTSNNQAGFELVYYNQIGEEISRRTVEVPALGRVDIQAGHEFSGTNNVGLLSVEPRIQGSPYVALLTRYAMKHVTDAAGSTHTSYSYALGILAESGTAAAQYAGIGGIGESMSVVELANVSQQTGAGILKWYSSEGASQTQESFSLAPNAQRHIIIPTQSLGSIEVDRESGNLLAATVVYHYSASSSSVSGVEYTPGTEPFGLSLYGSYNLNLGMNNWLRIFNATADESRVTVHYSQRGEADKTDDRSIPPHGRLDLGIHEKAARDTYGLVEVTTSSPGTLAAHVVRTRTSSARTGFNFTSATGVR